MNKRPVVSKRRENGPLTGWVERRRQQWIAELGGGRVGAAKWAARSNRAEKFLWVMSAVELLNRFHVAETGSMARYFSSLPSPSVLNAISEKTPDKKTIRKYLSLLRVIGGLPKFITGECTHVLLLRLTENRLSLEQSDRIVLEVPCRSCWLNGACDCLQEDIPRLNDPKAH